MCVRSDNGRECFGKEFGTLCRKHGIKQEFTPTDRPKYNSVAERALAPISDTPLAARIQAQVLYPGAQSYPALWTEAVSRACNALNRTATKKKAGNKSLYEMWHGSPSVAGEVWPFLKPKINHSRKHKTATRRRTQRQQPPRLHASAHCSPHHTDHPQFYLAIRPSYPSRAPAALAPHC